MTRNKNKSKITDSTIAQVRIVTVARGQLVPEINILSLALSETIVTSLSVAANTVEINNTANVSRQSSLSWSRNLPVSIILARGCTGTVLGR